MTTDLLIALGKANLAAGAAILAVIAVRKLVRKAFGAKLAYALWLAVPLAAIAVLLPARTTIETLTPAVLDPGPVAPPVTPIAPIVEPTALAAPPLDPWMITAWLWIAGALVTAVWLMRKQAAFMADARIGKAGPAVVGVLRPRIVTPSNFAEVFTDREQAVVFAHETTHIDRQDVRANAFAALARCVCWFNPLIHVAAFLMRIDQELACDAQVVARHPKARRTYAEAMLKAEMAGRPLPLGCCWPAGTEHPLTERIAMLKHDNPSRPRRLIGAASIAALCALGGLAAWAAQPAQIEYAPPPEQPAQTAPLPSDKLVNVPRDVTVEIPREVLQPVPQPERIGREGLAGVPGGTPERIEAPKAVPMRDRTQRIPDRAQPVPVEQPIDAARPLFAPDLYQMIINGRSAVDVATVFCKSNPGCLGHPATGADPYKQATTALNLPTARYVGRNGQLWGEVVLNGVRSPNAQIAVTDASGATRYIDIGPNHRGLAGPGIQPQGLTTILPPRPEPPRPIPSRYEQAPEPPQPVPASQQALPTQAPFPAWATPTAPNRGVAVTISGTITDVKWVNPSVQIFVRGDDGKDWYILSSAPNRVTSFGGSTEIIRKGVRLVTQAQQNRDIACAPLCVAMAREEQMAFNGAKLPLAPTTVAAPSLVFPPSKPWDGVDRASPVAVEGTITDVEWKNPSVLLHITDKSGQAWLVASGSPNTMLRAGASRQTVAKGAAVTLTGFRPLNKSCAPACGAFASPELTTLNGAKLVPPPAPLPSDSAQPVPSSYQPVPEPPQPAPVSQQQLPRYAPLGHGAKEQWAPIAISGTITDVKWFNPNVQIFVHSDDGKDWYVLTSTPNHVKSAGGSTSIIKKNVRITLNGQRALQACDPLCIAMAWETDMTFNGAKLSPAAGKPQPVPASFEPVPEPPQPPPATQKLPTQAPFPGWTTAESADRWAPTTISGTITDVRWLNPSTQIFVRGDDGRNWYILSSTPNTFLRAGGKREVVHKDVRIVAQAQQDLDIACAPLCVAMAQVEKLTVNGAKLGSGLQPTAYQPEEPQRSPAPAAYQIPESLLHLADAIDVTAPVAVTGTIFQVEWVNPSTLIHVHGSDGQDWVVASATPNTLLRAGVNREFLKVGSQFGAAGLRAVNKSCDRGCIMYAEPAAMLSNGAKPF